ncbi:hypothetical protein [Flagellimonas flava]|uniref:Uncharacterized protein n=1 Tax=Flagellimonas flava TaxID=570519 RepID=A0A1M5P7J8_9FLAO|nr:hypothetical protein [Allomuricauda flava]SHG97811.1 hypothetical protein SAMN04488116_3119 [Allomuricauda flava]
MGFFKKLFGGHTSLELVDSELGKFDSDYIKGENVTWIGSAVLFGVTIELLMDGSRENLSQNQKQIVLNALANEDLLKSESSIAISKEYNNADMMFTSLGEQLEVKTITSNENGFELSFEQKESPYYYFNVHFENNKQQGVSIDS